MTSVQTVVQGKIHVRRYNRIKLFEPKVLGIKKTADEYLTAGEQFSMTDQVDNIHWFGAESSGVILLNCNCDTKVGKTFYPREEKRKFRRHVDPTGGELRDGLIVAHEMQTKEEQDKHKEKFEFKPLSAFEA